MPISEELLLESLTVIELFLLYSGFNRCHFLLLRSYKRHEENKRKIGQERSSMQQADYHRHRPTPWMQESVSMNARKCVHECKKVCPWMQESVSMHKSPAPVRHSRMNQARSEEKEKERKRERKDRGQEADGKKGSSTKQKHIGGTKTRPT